MKKIYEAPNVVITTFDSLDATNRITVHNTLSLAAVGGNNSKSGRVTAQSLN